jgi:hypothetical protein
MIYDTAKRAIKKFMTGKEEVVSEKDAARAMIEKIAARSKSKAVEKKKQPVNYNGEDEYR